MYTTMYSIFARVSRGVHDKEVNLLKRVKTNGSWLFFPAAFTQRGAVRPDIVLVHGKEERHPEGAYYLEFRQNGKRVRQNAGKEAAEADNQRQAKDVPPPRSDLGLV